MGFLSVFPVALLETWLVIFASDLFRYLIAAGVLASFLAVFSGQLERRRIQSRRPKRSDVSREISFSLGTVVIFSLIGFAVHTGSQYGIFRIYSGNLPSAAILLLEFAAIVIIHDAYFYWAHRAMHHRKLFRFFHRIHHKSHTPTPWAAYSFALPEAVVEAGVLPLVALVLPMHELTAFLFVTHMIIRNVIGHAGIEMFPKWWLRVPLLRWITTTTHHDLHHSTFRYNYGLYFTWWDRLFATEHPEYRSRFEAVVTGRPDTEKDMNELTIFQKDEEYLR
ncbi:MAG: sterol desaturase [Gammaproteobacteria bacterium]|nr:MAG: sterol desaturase [Gammaproteobacteria bacterium]